MARSILKAHGGRIAVVSAENAGTTFTVTLPLVSIGQDMFANEPTTRQG
jgi:signal transduction histidine kinase